MDTHFDVLVLGTGLTQSITAAALAKAGFKVAHIDENSYYGSEQASLSHEELLEWSQSPPSNFSHISSSSKNPLPFSRSYSLSLAPALISSTGPLINSLILSGVSRYGQFKLLDAAFIHQHGTLERVPGNKEDVFKARHVPLVDKRKLMRFLQFSVGNFEQKTELQGNEATPFDDFMRDKFSLHEEAREAILYALAYCSSSSEPTLPALTRLRGFLRSAGRYGNSPFLVGHYGGLGELAQGFCRTCAVKGGTYILGHKILSLRLPSTSSTAEDACAAIHLEEVPDVLTADVVIASPGYLPLSNEPESKPGSVCLCAIAIVDRPIVVPESSSISSNDVTPSSIDDEAPTDALLDTVAIIFPPGSLPLGKARKAVHILQMGSATLSCPQGKYVLYAWTDINTSIETPEELLRPYFSALMPSPSESTPQTSETDFFFYARRESSMAVHASSPRTFVVPPLPSAWTEIADRSAHDAESLFWSVIQELKPKESSGIENFWPPLESVDENSGDDW